MNLPDNMRPSAFENKPAVWQIEIMPDVFLNLEKKPRLLTRFGMWLWFGWKGRDL